MTVRIEISANREADRTFTAPRGVRTTRRVTTLHAAAITRRAVVTLRARISARHPEAEITAGPAAVAGIPAAIAAETIARRIINLRIASPRRRAVGAVADQN